MDSKNILVGVVAAAVINVASAASGNLVVEKQTQAAVMADLLNGITVVMARPECTIKKE